MDKKNNQPLTPEQRKRRNKGRKIGLIAFGATVLLYSLIFPLYRPFDFVLCAVLALGAGKLFSIMGQGLDPEKLRGGAKQHPADDPLEEVLVTGDEDADLTIQRGMELLAQIRAENDAIPDPQLSAQMEQLESMCMQIFRTVADKPAKASQIRKFMNYYLPTTLRMLTGYRTMCERGVSQSEIDQSHASLVRGMEMVLTACQKQLDTLYRDTILDVSTDIDVLEQMLHRDGFADAAPVNSRTAASAQMNAGAPVLNVPDADDHIASMLDIKQSKHNP